MSARTIPDYPWKLFQMITLKLPGKLFLLPVGACMGVARIFCHYLFGVCFLTDWTIFGQIEAEIYYFNLEVPI